MSGPYHQRAPLASKVSLCETEKVTPPPRNATPTIKSKPGLEFQPPLAPSTGHPWLRYNHHKRLQPQL